VSDHFLAISFILLISFAGLKMKSLTISGAVAACFIGISIFAGFGYPGLILLGIFFGSSSFWSKFKRDQKKSVDDLLVKGDQRDAIQVLANGGVSALISIVNAFMPFDGSFTVYSASIAAANADTWASEIGTLSKKMPRMIFTLKQVKKGTSGAVSSLGTASAFFGAWLIGISAYLVFSIQAVDLLLIIMLGFIGNLIDTVLGASIQVQYQCPACGKKTERYSHCQKQGNKIKGFLNNDAVNFSAILAASLLAVLIY
jgi:uncharacterized protein (TIGR00297 family)